ncbi:MAG: iron-containing alcohol dehydrogenase, partial [Christensenellaceae bacterium]|nr:iron-containing alcohol dehydrogenase [Christensenellaceae bacterium]
VVPNPLLETADAAAALARECRADCIIGIGGGSAMDTAKAAAAFAPAGISAAEYAAGRPLPAARLPLILIPTTAGTGSEVTNVSVLTDAKTAKRTSLVGNILYADTAIIDPALSETMPPRVAAASGMDALCHAIESFWNVRSSPVSQALSMEAARRILIHLESAVKGDPDAREEMSIAATIAGIAFNQTRTTVCHAVSYRLTAHYGIDHGLACAATLPGFVQLAARDENVRPMLDRLAAYCGLAHAHALADAAAALYCAIGLPEKLSSLGCITPGHAMDVAAAGFAVPTVKLCRFAISFEDLLAVVESIL